MSVSLTRIAFAVVLLAGSAWIWIGVRRWYARRLRRRQWSRAMRAEAKAPRLLEELGFAILGAQVQGAYSLVVDGRPMTISLRADYLVSRDGRRYVAEVKSGHFAPLLETSATRRQLLEYLIAFDADGVLLVDGQAREVRQVVFPVRLRGLASRSASWLGWMAIGLATAGALVWVFRAP